MRVDVCPLFIVDGEALMTQKELIRRVTELARPLCEEKGLSLWDVTFEKEGRQHTLTVYIDREEGVNIDDCEAVSRGLDPLLDAREFDSLPAYMLQVSSAGLERPLTRPEHFAWAEGKKVVLRFYKAVDGAQELTGTLLGNDGVMITVETDSGARSFACADVAQTRLYFEF